MSGRPDQTTSLGTTPRAAENKDAAAAFILGSVAPEALDFVVEAKRVPPGVPVQVPQALLDEVPYITSVLSAAESAVSYAPSGVGDRVTDVMNIVGDSFQAMLVNNMSAQEAAQSIQDQLAALLAG